MAPDALPTLRVSDTLRASLRRGHPWLYRDHVPEVATWRCGQWVRVNCGGFETVGIVDPASALAVRLFRSPGVPDDNWLASQLENALERRRPVLSDGRTSAYRLLNGEGDGLPGIVIDVYGPQAVLRLDSECLTDLALKLVPIAMQRLGLKGLSRRSGAHMQVVAGRAPPSKLIVTEHGLRMHADIATGQKTGLYLDHRDNRRWLAPQCASKHVLNLFAYTGGFSLHASLAGALRVVSVDRAGEAVGRITDNLQLNGLPTDNHEGVTSDVESFLQGAIERGETFDVVVTDPPSFARSKVHRKKAARAYEMLHSQALRVLAPGGLYAAASCTSQVGPEAFRETLAAGASRSRRAMQIVAELGQASDHPVALGHPEGRYLKFVAARCLQAAGTSA